MNIKLICSMLNIPDLQRKMTDPSSRHEDGHLIASFLSPLTSSRNKMELEKIQSLEEFLRYADR